MTIKYAQSLQRGDIVEIGEDMPAELTAVRRGVCGMILLQWGDACDQSRLVNGFTQFEFLGHVDLLPFSQGAVG